jgi:hypothetical protein
MTRLTFTVVGVALVGAVVEPILHAEPRDGYPFSTYPMFSSRKVSAETTVSHAVAIEKGAPPRALSPRMLGTEEVLQARANVQHAIDAGPAAAKQLCVEVAARVAADAALAGIDAVEIRTDTYDAVAYLEGKTTPSTAKRHARCAVTRPVP